jgi:hypothetical protein
MKEKRRLEVVWETHQITTISFRHKSAAMIYCQACRAPTLHLTVSEFASLSNLSELAIFRLVETNQIHSIESFVGALLVCGDSFPVRNKK